MRRSKIPSTAELRDDEGTVYVAWSEGAPFMVLGRRHDGQFYVSGLGRTRSLQEVEAAIEAMVAQEGHGPELVTGKEADDLIAAIEKEQRAIRPVWAFRRDRHIEIDRNFMLAGTLFLDIPKKEMKKNSGQEIVTDITNFLIDNLKDDDDAFGWPNRHTPYCADEFLDNEKLMHAWLDRCFCVAVRVDSNWIDGQ
jgi:hypothetical protein